MPQRRLECALVRCQLAFIISIPFVFRCRGLLAVLFTSLLIYRLEPYGSDNFGITLRELGFSVSGDDVANFFFFISGHLNITDWAPVAQTYDDPSILIDGVEL